MQNEYNNDPELRALHENYEDALFRLAIHKAAEQEGKFIEEKENSIIYDSVYLPSSESETKTFKLIDNALKQNRKENKEKRSHLTVKRLVVIIAAVLVLFSLTLLTVDAFRIEVFNFVLGIKERYTSMQIKENGGSQSQIIVDWNNAYAPTYLPDGYEVYSILNTEEIKTITLRNEDERSFIVYSEYDTTTKIDLDTEGASTVKTISINGNNGTLITKNDSTTVAWILDNKLFTVVGPANSDLQLKIAESVKYIK